MATTKIKDQETENAIHYLGLGTIVFGVGVAVLTAGLGGPALVTIGGIVLYGVGGALFGPDQPTRFLAKCFVAGAQKVSNAFSKLPPSPT